MGIEVYRLEKWHQKALQGIETALKAREGDPLSAELNAVMRRIGEITMENELLRYKVRKARPLVRRDRRNERYDLYDYRQAPRYPARLSCLEEPRSSFYGRMERLAKPSVTRKRGPKTLFSDDELLTLIRTDLATSHFIGEGHRKVWARLRFVKGTQGWPQAIARL